MLRFFNTLTRRIEDFKPISPSQVGIYTCGPTVYDYPHIGNLRTFVFSDIMQRVLVYNGYQVKSVQNITDIDDKIIKKAKAEQVEMAHITFKFTKIFLKDIKKLNILEKDVMPRATEYIVKMIDYIKVLIEKGFAYVEEDGSVYFDISKFSNYGKLSGIETENLKSGTRILSDEYTKDSVQDFALWKSEPEEEVGYESPWGRGRPGWHIECSVMSQDNLGETFDIHGGGIDLIFPHHENEIAQSEAKTGKKFVNYFIHAAHILVDGKKMSKSLNNFYTLRDVEEKGFEPLSLRYLYLQTQYRQELNFTWESLKGAMNALNKLREEFVNWEEEKVGCAEFEEQFLEAINDDLNMPKALSVVWEMVKSDYPGSAKKKSLLKFDEILGLGLKDYKKEEINVPEEVKELLSKREAFRKSGEFEKADEVRKQIEELGFVVEDTSEGAKLGKK